MRRMLTFAAAALVTIASAASGQQPAAPAPLLIDHFIGNWVLTGTIDGKQTTHDVDAQWVLNHGYVRMHEVSREKAATGAPAFDTTWPSTVTCPARINARARSRDVTRPRSTRAMSSRVPLAIARRRRAVKRRSDLRSRPDRAPATRE